MLHILHLIQRRRGGQPIPGAVPMVIVSALALLAGLGLLMGR